MQWARESSRGRLALEPVPSGHVAAPDPYVKKRGVRAGAGGPGLLWGSEVSAVSSGLPLLRGTWRLRTHPQARSGSGAVGLVRDESGPWGLATLSFPHSYVLPCRSYLAAVRVGIPATGYRHRERRKLCHATGANPVSPKLFGNCFVL